MEVSPFWGGARLSRALPRVRQLLGRAVSQGDESAGPAAVLAFRGAHLRMRPRRGRPRENTRGIHGLRSVRERKPRAPHPHPPALRAPAAAVQSAVSAHRWGSASSTCTISASPTRAKWTARCRSGCGSRTVSTQSGVGWVGLRHGRSARDRPIPTFKPPSGGKGACPARAKP